MKWALLECEMGHFARRKIGGRDGVLRKWLRDKGLRIVTISALFPTILRAVRREKDFQSFPGEIFNLADRIFRFFILYVLSYENIIKKRGTEL